MSPEQYQYKPSAALFLRPNHCETTTMFHFICFFFCIKIDLLDYMLKIEKYRKDINCNKDHVILQKDDISKSICNFSIAKNYLFSS